MNVRLVFKISFTNSQSLPVGEILQVTSFLTRTVVMTSTKNTVFLVVFSSANARLLLTTLVVFKHSRVIGNVIILYSLFLQGTVITQAVSLVSTLHTTVYNLQLFNANKLLLTANIQPTENTTITRSLLLRHFP